MFVRKKLQNLSFYPFPSQLSEEEITNKVIEYITASNASSVKDMGKVMGMFNKNVTKGSFDGSLVSKIVKEQLMKI